MPNITFRRILYFICAVIAVTASIQLYWNYKNYIDGQQQLIREVQSSVDNAIDSYFIVMAERNTIGISVTTDGEVLEKTRVDSLLHRMGSPGLRKGEDFLQDIDPSGISEMEVISGYELRKQDSLHNLKVTSDNQNVQRDLNLAKRIILSFRVDTLNLEALNEYIDDQLGAKGIKVDYAYIFKNKNGNTQHYNQEILNKNKLSTTANSAYLPKDSSFEFYFTNITATVLKRNSLGIAFSVVLISTVVACLFFLLKIINRQKQLVELKNDLISNITHEFKTPISTAKVALEGIEFFNEENDPEKTKNYLQVSNNQLDKLQVMVEKLLETATLDGHNLPLKKEEISVVTLLENLVEQHRNLSKSKKFVFTALEKEIKILVDPFHFENALNNILDNAVKYGGNKVEVTVSFINKVLKIEISDNGKNLTSSQAEQVFDKFYRVPKGNTHDVKGFGIGLYYTENIIEKHGGSIKLLLNNQTSFQITIPHNA